MAEQRFQVQIQLLVTQEIQVVLPVQLLQDLLLLLPMVVVAVADMPHQIREEERLVPQEEVAEAVDHLNQVH